MADISSHISGFAQADTDIAAVLKAVHFAAERHCGRLRLSERVIPEINHPIEVAMLVATHGGDLVTVQSAILHDTVEDTDTSLAEIEDHFGAEVASVVGELTDDPSLSGLDRKLAQINSMPRKSLRARFAKIADQTSNARYVVEHPPAKWSPAKCKDYLLKTKAVVNAGRGTCLSLEAKYDTIFARGAQKYGFSVVEVWPPADVLKSRTEC